MKDRILRWALGGKESLDILIRRLQGAPSLRSELRTLGIPVVDDATVDVLGM